MGREKVIGDFTFPSRKAAEESIKAILAGAALQTPLVGDEDALLRGLVACHPAAAEKIGPGIRHIDVRIIEYGQRGFWLTRVDGSSTDFSYRKALDGAPSHRTLVLGALRREIRGQVEQFRADYFATDPNPWCELTDQPLFNNPDSHVDHIRPFVEIAEEWVRQAGGWDRLETKPADDGIGRILADRAAAVDWRGWHARHAHLRVIHRSANLARHRTPAA